MVLKPGNPVVGGTVLRRAAIRSPNFVQGVRGWTINQDGSAEFDALTIGSTTAGTTTIDMHGNIKVVNSHGAVVMYLSAQLSAFFQYQDLGTSSQGPLILTIASVAGNDPVNGTAYQPGMTGIDPAFGDAIITVGANISLTQVPYTRNAKMAAATGSGANQPKLQLDAPEQTQASHLQMWITGESPDASKPAQLILAAVSGAGVLAPQTTALLEVQGTIAADLVEAIIGGVAETWHNLALVNGWAGTARYRLLPDGRVELDVNISSAAATAIQFSTMPAGYRPANTVHVAAGTTGNLAAFHGGYIEIVAATGVITMNGLNAFSAAGSWVAGGSYPLN